MPNSFRTMLNGYSDRAETLTEAAMRYMGVKPFYRFNPYCDNDYYRTYCHAKFGFSIFEAECERVNK